MKRTSKKTAPTGKGRMRQGTPRKLQPNLRLTAQRRKQLGKHYVNRYGVGSR
jgi:hypothetical protein